MSRKHEIELSNLKPFKKFKPRDMGFDIVLHVINGTLYFMDDRSNLLGKIEAVPTDDDVCSLHFTPAEDRFFE